MYSPDGETYYIVLFIFAASVVCVVALAILFFYALFFKKEPEVHTPTEDKMATSMEEVFHKD